MYARMGEINKYTVDRICRASHCQRKKVNKEKAKTELTLVWDCNGRHQYELIVLRQKNAKISMKLFVYMD